MKAMLFAAGLGTRLGELTKDKPKALVEVNGKTLLEHSVEYLKSYGVTTIVINVHHFAQKIIDFLESKNNFGIEFIISDETEMLLETGGGLLKAKEYFNEDFIVYNTDIITDLDLDKFIEFHKKHDGIASLAVRKRETQRYIIFDENFLLSGWTNISTGEKIISREFNESNLRAFSGVHILSPKIFKLLEKCTQEKFSITKAYIDFSKNEKFYGFEHNYGYWIDTGKPQDLERAKSIV